MSKETLWAALFLTLLIGFLVFPACVLPAQAQELAAGLPPNIRQEIPAGERLPAGQYQAIHAWSAAGPEAAHQTGRKVADPDATSGQAWQAQVGQASADSALLYGPYRPTPAGDYVTFFRLELLDDVGEESVASIDAADSNVRVLRTRNLTGAELAVGRYVQVPLAFHHPGGRLECRVMWRGAAGLRVEGVTLFGLVGGTIDPNAGRAPQPRATGRPNGLTWRGPVPSGVGLFPRSAAPAPDLAVFDLRTQSPDWRLALLSLQGLVNRSRPRLYCLVNPPDADWLAWMRRRGWVQRTHTLATPQDVLREFRSSLGGVILTDPALPATKNVATMLAGLSGGVPASPRFAQTLGLPVLEDLRGRWKTNVAAYRWAFDTLWPRLNHRVIACLAPDQMPVRDYLVENRVFIFWLSGPIDGARPYADPQAEVVLMEGLLPRMPVNIPVMGYPWDGKDVGIGEGPGVTLFAEFGKYLVGSVDTSNLSVHSGVPVTRLKQRPAPRTPRLDPKRVYVSWIMSDGDNLPVLSNFNFPTLWKDPMRGRFPIGWSASPSALQLLPDVMDYYYATSTPNDVWLGAVSGVGYTYPDSYAARYVPADRRRIYDGFLGQTAVMMGRLDETMLWPMNVTREDLIARYAEKIPSLQALFPDYGRRVAGYDEATYPTARNVPVFHALTAWSENIPRETQIASLVAQIRAATPAARPVFLHLFIWNWGADLPLLQEVLRRLGPSYTAVRPDHLAALYRQYEARQKLLVRAPPTVVALEGHPLSFAVTVQNVTGQPMTVAARAAGGLTGATLVPARLRLAPSQSATVSITGAATGATASLVWTGPLGVRESAVPLRRLSAAGLDVRLPSGTTLKFVRQFGAVGLSHEAGHVAPDPQAATGAVWEATAGTDPPGYMIYGPYAPLARGRYLVVFRLARAGAADGTLATVDTCVGGGTPVTATRTLSAADLPDGPYRSVGLVLTHPGGPLETRLQWTGKANLRAESVTLWRIETPKGKTTQRR